MTTTQSVLARDIGFSLVFTAVGLVLALDLKTGSSLWAAAVATAAIFMVVNFLSDREEVSWKVSYAAGIVFVFVSTSAYFLDSIPLGLLPAMIIGLAAGVGLNRVVFGVIRPMPQAYRRRMGLD